MLVLFERYYANHRVGEEGSPISSPSPLSLHLPLHLINNNYEYDVCIQFDFNDCLLHDYV